MENTILRDTAGNTEGGGGGGKTTPSCPLGTNHMAINGSFLPLMELAK